jgi:DNA-binding transcriptional LysR family regulator
LDPALLADWPVADELERERLVDLLPGYDVTATTFGTAAWLLYPSREYLPRKVRASVDFLRGRLGRAAA